MHDPKATRGASVAQDPCRRYADHGAVLSGLCLVCRCLFRAIWYHDSAVKKKDVSARDANLFGCNPFKLLSPRILGNAVHIPSFLLDSTDRCFL